MSSVTFSRAHDDEHDLKLLIPGQRTNQEGQIHLKPEATLEFNFKTTTKSPRSPQHVIFTSLFLSHYVLNLLSLLLPFFILFITPSDTSVLTIHSYKCAASKLPAEHSAIKHTTDACARAVKCFTVKYLQTCYPSFGPAKPKRSSRWRCAAPAVPLWRPENGKRFKATVPRRSTL